MIHEETKRSRRHSRVALAMAMCAVSLLPLSAATHAFDPTIKTFFEKHCTECHGEKKSKGKITLHTLDGTMSGDHEETWHDVLDVLKSGDMPPDDEPIQPTEAQRAAVIAWIEEALEKKSATAEEAPVPTLARRLTNLEYENTMRDLLGIDLQLAHNLPVDPVKPYHFNNNPELMRMGPEQIERYLEAARHAMAGAIVDPGKPEVHKSRGEWKPGGFERLMAADEVGVSGGSPNTAAHGIGFSSFPKYGEFRIRIQASALLPKGVEEAPLQVMMGYSYQRFSTSPIIEPVGTAFLKNSPDNPEVLEFRGRIENYAPRPGALKNGVRQPDTMGIQLQVIHNDGTLNDRKSNLSYPRAVINWMEFEAPVTDTWPPEHHTRILPDSPLREGNTPAYVAAVLEKFISRAYRRPARKEEIERFVKIYRIIEPDKETFEAAMRETLAMVLVSPKFLYHTLADDDATRPYELASRLSYFLTGTMPDAELLRLAAEGKLNDDTVIAEQAQRLLDDPRSADFVRNFTMQWLSLDKSLTVPINLDLYPRFLYTSGVGETIGKEIPNVPTIRGYMLDETVGFIGELIRRNDSVLKIVDSDFAYLNEPLAAHYGVPGVKGITLRPVPIKPEHKLGGLPTHGSVLIGNGTGTAPHPIYRAVWLREAILGDEVAPPPADVPALTDTAGESAEHALSIKDLLRIHRTQESCNDCHFRLDPWGIPFEQYNAIGKFQPVVPQNGVRVGKFDPRYHADEKAYAEYVTSLNTVKMEADARLPSGADVNGMEDLKKYLLANRSEEIARNVIRRLLTYGLGRPLSHSDRADVEAILSYTKMNGLGLRDMIVTICRSPLMRDTNPN
jgi:hypothetical protein